MAETPVGVFIATSTAPGQIPPLAARAEDLGFGELWLAEDYFCYGGFTAAALALVLGSALLHATWNLLAKRARGGVAFLWLLTVGTAVIYAPVAGLYLYLARPGLTAGSGPTPGPSPPAPAAASR